MGRVLLGLALMASACNAKLADLPPETDDAGVDSSLLIDAAPDALVLGAWGREVGELARGIDSRQVEPERDAKSGKFGVEQFLFNIQNPEVTVKEVAEAAIATAPPAARVATQALGAAERRPTQLRWNSRPRRDPFAPPPADTHITELAPPTVPQPAYAPLLEAPPPTPTLTALLDTPSAKIAVIDGRLVRVGDAVNGRPVLAIGAGSVALGPTPTTPQPLLLKLPRP